MQIPQYIIPAKAGSYHCLAGSYHRFAVIQEAKNKMDPGLRRDDNKNGMTTKIDQFEKC